MTTTKISHYRVSHIESWISHWGNINTGHATMFFDESLVEELAKVLHEGIGIITCAPDQTKKLIMKTIIIEWYNVGGSKAILKSVTDLEGTIIYYAPNKWEYDKMFSIY